MSVGTLWKMKVEEGVAVITFDKGGPMKWADLTGLSENFMGRNFTETQF